MNSFRTGAEDWMMDLQLEMLVDKGRGRGGSRSTLGTIVFFKRLFYYYILSLYNYITKKEV
jgi:hypothetical protein